MKQELLRGWIDAWVASQSFPGMMVGLFDKDGKEIFYHAADNATHVPSMKPYSRDTLFRLYSLTKPITTVAAMILLERGQLSLDDELAHYIPSFADAKVLVAGAANSTADSPVTEALHRPLLLRDILSHTTGIT
jgi:CubicO group peptidase (beta-lactamase class C family)